MSKLEEVDKTRQRIKSTNRYNTWFKHDSSTHLHEVTQLPAFISQGREILYHFLCLPANFLLCHVPCWGSKGGRWSELGVLVQKRTKGGGCHWDIHRSVSKNKVLRDCNKLLNWVGCRGTSFLHNTHFITSVFVVWCNLPLLCLLLQVCSTILKTVSI